MNFFNHNSALSSTKTTKKKYVQLHSLTHVIHNACKLNMNSTTTMQTTATT